MSFLFETYGFLYPMIWVSDSRRHFKPWDLRHGNEVFVMAVMAVRWAGSAIFCVRFLIALCNEREPRRMGDWFAYDSALHRHNCWTAAVEEAIDARRVRTPWMRAAIQSKQGWFGREGLVSDVDPRSIHGTIRRTVPPLTKPSSRALARTRPKNGNKYRNLKRIVELPPPVWPLLELLPTVEELKTQSAISQSQVKQNGLLRYGGMRRQLGVFIGSCGWIIVRRLSRMFGVAMLDSEKKLL
jgi:hypothetical protein